jgi:hypothetical protein
MIKKVYVLLRDSKISHICGIFTSMEKLIKERDNILENTVYRKASYKIWLCQYEE